MEQQNQNQSQKSGQNAAEANMGRMADIDFLNMVFKNAETGANSIETIVKHVTDTELKDVLLAQFEDYDRFRTKLTKHITSRGETPKKGNPISKATMWSTINFSALMDDSSSHIADMMIKGSNMGITTLTKELNACRSIIDKDSEALAEELLTIEQNNIEQLKPFL